MRSLPEAKVKSNFKSGETYRVYISPCLFTRDTKLLGG